MLLLLKVPVASVVRSSREGALELSIGTIVVIVIGMSMLILGLVLVRNIFGGATGSVDALNDQVMSEITNLFGNDQGNLIVKLGSSNVAKVKAGDQFRVAIGAQHPDGLSAQQLEYKVELEDDSDNNCIAKIGRARAEALISSPRLGDYHEFTKFSGSVGGAIIEIKVPESTAVCTQKVSVFMRVVGSADALDGDSFLLEVAKKGIL
jgi:hypothetical protein